jgi:hypothetical protein
MPGTISLIGKAVAMGVAKKFGGKVIERWTRYRADRFFEGFAETVGLEISTGVLSEEVDKRLQETSSTAKRLRSFPTHSSRVAVATTPLGLFVSAPFLRVARASQPWALRRSPIGIHAVIPLPFIPLP